MKNSSYASLINEKFAMSVMKMFTLRTLRRLLPPASSTALMFFNVCLWVKVREILLDQIIIYRLSAETMVNYRAILGGALDELQIRAGNSSNISRAEK